MSLFSLISDSGLLNIDSLPSANTALLFGVKSMFVIAGVLYTLFSILVTRQISIMSKTIATTASFHMKLLGFIHLIVAILVLIYFIMVL